MVSWPSLSISPTQKGLVSQDTNHSWKLPTAPCHFCPTPVVLTRSYDSCNLHKYVVYDVELSADNWLYRKVLNMIRKYIMTHSIWHWWCSYETVTILFSVFLYLSFLCTMKNTKGRRRRKIRGFKVGLYGTKHQVISSLQRLFFPSLVENSYWCFHQCYGISVSVSSFSIFSTATSPSASVAGWLYKGIVSPAHLDTCVQMWCIQSKPYRAVV